MNPIRTIYFDGPSPGFLGASAVAMGNFDGIHRGHKVIIQTLIERARQMRLPPVLLTFDPHPRIVFGQDFKILTTVYEREILLRRLGVEMIVHIRFTRQFAAIEYEEFVRDYLVRSLGAKVVVVGYDHHFGRGRAGNPKALAQLGEKYNFETIIVPPVKHRGQEVRSSLIRELIGTGKIEVANDFLGHPYLVAGKVIAGRGLGRQIGYPTANLEISPFKLLPPDGVYAARTRIIPEGNLRDSMVYIGQAPTFNLPHRMFEVHIMDYEGEPLYNRFLAVYLIKFVRPDRAFRTVKELEEQISRDAEITREILNSRADAILFP